MEFKISKTNFLDAIRIGASMSGKNKTLPMHSQAKITIKGNNFIVSSFDGEVAVTKKVVGVEASEDAVFCIEPKEIVSLVKSLRDNDLLFSVNENTLVISYKKGKAEFSVFSAEDFATPIEEEYSIKFNVKAQDLFNLLNISKDFVSTDTLRPVMNGVFMYIEEGRFGVASTDSVKLFNDFVTHEYNGETNGVVLSSKTTNVILSMINGYEDVEISFGEKSVTATVSDSRMIARRIEGRYPNFKAVIPQQNKTRLSIDKEDLLDTLSRIMFVANKASMSIKMTKKPMQLIVESRDYEFGKKAEETCMCDSDCEEFVIGAHGGNLITAIRSIESDTVEFLFTDVNRPIVLKDGNNHNRTIIVMPSRVD
jgi:DNA polymerase-3 subunit beta